MAATNPTPAESAEIDALFALAHREYSAGRLAEAAAAYRKILALRPDLAEASNNLGNVLKDQGKLAEAVAHYERAVALNPKLFGAHNNLGNVLCRRGRLHEAAAHYERAAALNPSHFEAHSNLGNILRQLGKFDQAQARFEQALALRPDLALAHYNLGVVLREQGQLDQAQARLEQALTLKPNLVEAISNLATVFREQGKLDLAQARFEQVIDLRPDLADAYANLGNVLWERGKLHEAAIRYERAAAINPNLFQVHTNLGNILRHFGKLEQAQARFEQALALRPDLALAHYNLGVILREQGQLELAQARFEQALVLSPDLVEAITNLATVLQQRGQLDLAVTRFEQALALRPDLVEAIGNLATVLQQQGKLDLAQARFEQALALRPEVAEAHYNLGTLLREQGKLDQSRACFDQALALRPDYAAAHCHRADLKTFRPGDGDLATLEALAADPGRLPPSEMLFIHFALGKALDDVGDYERAFEHLLQGNALKRRQFKSNELASQQDFRRIAEVFDSSLLARFEGSGDPSPAPIFILGMPRSGSTLVEQILASHPQVQAGGELQNLERVVRALSDSAGRRVPFPQSIRGIDGDSLRRLEQDYLASLPALADGKTRITDKMPGNFLYVGLIRLILPNARIIHTTRDPIDTCLSCFSRLFAVGQAFSYDLAELGRYYRGYHGLMAHWRSVLPAGAMLDISYEDVVDNLEEQARRLIDFCGLPWDDRCLNFHETRRPIATSSNVQVRQPLYRSSLARWHRYEKHLQPLLAELDGCRQR